MLEYAASVGSCERNLGYWWVIACGLVLLGAGAWAEEPAMGPRKSYPNTTLVAEGRANCAVILPEHSGYEGLGQRITAAIKEKTGADVPVLTSQRVADRPFHLADEYRDVHLIVLGNATNNVAHLALYGNLLALADGEWPGAGGFELRTACNPFGTERNCIVLGGTDVAGVAAAVDTMLARLDGLPDGKTLTLPRWCTVVIEGKDQAETDVQSFPDPEGTRAGQSNFNAAWRAYQHTGHPEVLAYLEKCMHWIAAGGTGWGHYWGPVLIDPLEFCSNIGLVEGEELAKIDNWLLETVERGRDYSLYMGPHEGNVGNRHQTYGTYGFYRSWRYLLRGTPNEAAREYLEPLVEGTRQYLDSLLAGYRDDTEDKPSFDSTGILVRFAAGEGRFDWWTSGQGRLCALRGLFCRDNLGYFCGSGGAGWNAPELRGGIAVGNAVAAAAFFNRDPQLAWFGYEGGFLWTVAVPSWRLPDDLKPQPPVSLLGAQVLPVNRPHWERLVEQQPEAYLPYERSFEKLVFRHGFDPADQYLILNGLDTGNDVNAIMRYTDRGHIFLFQNQKSENHFHRNAVYVSRGLDEKKPLPLAEVQAHANFDDVSLSITSLHDYNGVDWERNIVQRRGKYFVVIDVCRAEIPGEYAMACHWRSPGAGGLTGNTWRIPAGLDQFVLQCASDAVLRLEPIKDRPFAEFEEGAGFVLRQDQSGHKEAGSVTTFLNMFYATGPDKPQALRMRRFNERAVLVKDGLAGNEIALIGTGPLEAADLTIDADLYFISNTRWHLVGERQASPPRDIARTLRRLWQLSRAAKLQHGGAERVAPGPATPLWQAEVAHTQPSPIRSVSITSDRPFSRGTPDDLIDGQMPMYFNLKTAWPVGTQLVFDFGEPTGLAEVDVRFISGTGGWKSVGLELSDDNFVNDVRPVMVEGTGGDFYQVPWNSYDYALFEGATIPINARARYARMTMQAADSGAEIIFRAGSTRQARPRSLQVADLDGDGESEIVVATDLEEVAAFSAGGDRVWSHQVKGWITRVLIADLENDGRQEVIVSTFDSHLYAFAADGVERWHWHRDITLSEFGSVGLWKRDDAGRAEVVGTGYTGFAIVDAAGNQVALPQTGGVRSDDALPMGTDLTGDAIDDQVIHGYYTSNLFVLDGATLLQGESIGVPIGAALGVDLIDQRAGVARVLCMTTGGVALAQVTEPHIEAAKSVTDASGLEREVAGVSPHVKTQWRYPIGPINAYALIEQDGDGPPLIAIGKRDGLLTLLDAEGQLVADASMGTSIRSIAATGSGETARIAVATRQGIHVLDSQLKVQSLVALPDCGAVGWLPGKQGLRLVAMSDGGRVFAFGTK